MIESSEINSFVLDHCTVRMFVLCLSLLTANISNNNKITQKKRDNKKYYALKRGSKLMFFQHKILATTILTSKNHIDKICIRK